MGLPSDDYVMTMQLVGSHFRQAVLEPLLAALGPHVQPAALTSHALVTWYLSRGTPSYHVVIMWLSRGYHVVLLPPHVVIMWYVYTW